MHGWRLMLVRLLVVLTLVAFLGGSWFITGLVWSTPVYALPVALFIVTPVIWIFGTLTILVAGRFVLVLPYLLVSVGALYGLLLMQIFAATIVDAATIPPLVAFNGIAVIVGWQFLDGLTAQPEVS
jgi:hypothetical protein